MDEEEYWILDFGFWILDFGFWILALWDFLWLKSRESFGITCGSGTTSRHRTCTCAPWDVHEESLERELHRPLYNALREAKERLEPVVLEQHAEVDAQRR